MPYKTIKTDIYSPMWALARCNWYFQHFQDYVYAYMAFEIQKEEHATHDRLMRRARKLGRLAQAHFYCFPLPKHHEGRFLGVYESLEEIDRLFVRPVCEQLYGWKYAHTPIIICKRFVAKSWFEFSYPMKYYKTPPTPFGTETVFTIHDRVHKTTQETTLLGCDTL